MPTAAGPLWLKAPAPALRYEAGLYQLLVRVAGYRVLTPVAADRERGWLLLPDGGPSLRDSGLDLAAAIPYYAQLQRDLAAHVDALLALGVPDMRPPAMPERLEDALPAAPEAERLRPLVREWAERLAASPVPVSLDHNDLHDGNVLAGPRFYDWGDSVVAHPFASLLCLEWVRDGRDRLRDAYLEAFTDLAPRAQLAEEAELAVRLAHVARALTWQRALSSVPLDAVDEQWRSGPSEALHQLLRRVAD